MRTMVLLLALCPMVTFGMERLDALSMLETGNNDRMVGRAGEISRYQILKREWRTVTNSLRYTDPDTAKRVTLVLIDRRVQTFQATYSRRPTNYELYALWNAPSQILSGRVSPTVADRCRRFANLCAWTGTPTPYASAAAPHANPVLLCQTQAR